MAATDEQPDLLDRLRYATECEAVRDLGGKAACRASASAPGAGSVLAGLWLLIVASAPSPSSQRSGEASVHVVDPLRRDRAAELPEMVHEHPSRQDDYASALRNGGDQV